MHRRDFLTSTSAAGLLAATAPGLLLADAALAKGRKPLPGFSTQTLSGKKWTASEHKGNVLVVSFWATWCAPCLQELPFIEQAYRKWNKHGLDVLAISIDGPETASKINTIVKRRRLTMPVAHDGAGSVLAKLNPRGVPPYTIFVDRKQRVAWAHEGYSAGEEKKYFKVIQKLLKEKA